jgi:hypothetical protein
MEENELMIRPLQAPLQSGVSIINENPIGILEKLGKYEFIYDYNAVPAPFYTLKDTFYNHQNLKEGGSNANMIATSGIWSGQSFPQPVKVNSEAQVGVFSKGNIVNVVRFDGNNAIIENINYKEPDPSVEKTFWGELLGGVVNKKELSIPKDYLRKVDDTLNATIFTGINYGANMKPQPVFISTPIKPIPNKLLESNATYYLKKDFQYTSGSHQENCQNLEGKIRCQTVFDNKILKAGDKVVGDLIETCGVTDKVSMSVKCSQFLSVNTNSQFGDFGHTLVPIEYLTKDVPTNNGAVVPAKNDNKNLLMIVGAFLVGYVVFSKGKSNN